MQKKELSNRNRADDRPEAPPCCGTGCTVCVLDYWEEDSRHGCKAEADDSSSLQLLEAIEDAQLLVISMLDRSGSE